MQALVSSRALRSSLSPVGDAMPFAALACLSAIINLCSVVRLVGCALLGSLEMKRRPCQVAICCVSYLASLAMAYVVDNNNQLRNACIILLLVNGILLAMYEGENVWHVSATDSTSLNRLFVAFVFLTCVLIIGLSTWLTIRSDDLSQILMTLLSSTSGIYALLAFGNLHLFRSQKKKNWIARGILAVGWVGCFSASVSTLIFLILGCKGIVGGLTFYTWVAFTVSSIFTIRNPTVKLWRLMFSNNQTRDGRFPVDSGPGSRIPSTKSRNDWISLESNGGAPQGGAGTVSAVAEGQA